MIPEKKDTAIIILVEPGIAKLLNLTKVIKYKKRGKKIKNNPRNVSLSGFILLDQYWPFIVFKVS